MVFILLLKMGNAIENDSFFFLCFVCLIEKSRMHTNLMKVACCLQSQSHKRRVRLPHRHRCACACAFVWVCVFACVHGAVGHRQRTSWNVQFSRSWSVTVKASYKTREAIIFCCRFYWIIFIVEIFILSTTKAKKGNPRFQIKAKQQNKNCSFMDPNVHIKSCVSNGHK